MLDERRGWPRFDVHHRRMALIMKRPACLAAQVARPCAGAVLTALTTARRRWQSSGGCPHLIGPCNPLVTEPRFGASKTLAIPGRLELPTFGLGMVESCCLDNSRQCTDFDE